MREYRKALRASRRVYAPPNRANGSRLHDLKTAKSELIDFANRVRSLGRASANTLAEYEEDRAEWFRRVVKRWSHGAQWRAHHGEREA